MRIYATPSGVEQVRVNNLACRQSPLRWISEEVSVDDPRLPSVCARLKKVVTSVDICTGLSAIQLGLPLRICVVSLERDLLDMVVMINPKLASVSGRWEERWEGCLSLPNYKGLVRRRSKITCIYYDETGRELELKAKGYRAAVIQHEIDHMNGVLYWDRMVESRSLQPLTEDTDE